ADAHNDAAVDLAFAGELAHDQSAILDARDFLHFDETCLGVHFDLGKLDATRAARRETFLPLAGDVQRINAEFLASLSPMLAAGVRHAGLLLHFLESFSAKVVDRRGYRGRRRAAAAAAGGWVSRIPDSHNNLFGFQ